MAATYISHHLTTASSRGGARRVVESVAEEKQSRRYIELTRPRDGPRCGSSGGGQQVIAFDTATHEQEKRARFSRWSPPLLT